jgi:AraC family transcriptional regulator of adaptative response / DNA-3-methyladenine glycosylase II
MRLIADGAVNRDGVPGLARALAVSERHLNRLLVAELGASPLALARAQRAQTGRVLIETTTMQFGHVALAAGFSSVRQFNDTIRDVFAATPRQLRERRNGGLPSNSVLSGISVRLPFRAPYDAGALMRFLGARAVAGIESWDGTTYRRSLRLPNGTGVAACRLGDGHIACELRLDALADLQAALQRSRRLLDLDADPVAIDAALAADDRLAPLVARRPGLRSPGMVDGTEALVRAIVGQQVSVSGARTVLGRIVARLGTPLAEPVDGITHTFPTAHELSVAEDDALPMPATRREALREACRRIACGEISVDAGTDRDELRRGLVAVSGVGSWTAEYVAMRALGDPDAFPASDLGVRHGLAHTGTIATPRQISVIAESWRPWRAYATHHLWNHLEAA